MLRFKPICCLLHMLLLLLIDNIRITKCFIPQHRQHSTSRICPDRQKRSNALIFYQKEHHNKNNRNVVSNEISFAVRGEQREEEFNNTEKSLKQLQLSKTTPTIPMHMPTGMTTRTDISRGTILVSLLSACFIFNLLPAIAIDHPIDYAHLNIPNPIPDADPRYFLSGGLCAAASHGVTTPIDVVKTKIQANPEIYNKGTLDAAIKILKEDGKNSLLKGLGPTVIGYGLEGAAKFGLYESLKPQMIRLLDGADNTAIAYLAASIVAGAVAAIMLCPMEQTRIRLVTDPTFESNFLKGIPKLIEESGALSLFVGLTAMLSKQVPYTFGKQVSFDAIAASLYGVAASSDIDVPDIKLVVSFCAAFLASIIACIMSHPGDVILTETYKSGANNGNAFKDIVSKVYNDQGVKGFFSGLTARFFHVGAIITSQLVLYDFVKQSLGLPATGS